MSSLNTKYSIIISDDEICYLMNLFNIKNRKKVKHIINVFH